MNIPMLDLNRTHAPISEALSSAFQRVLENNSYILGPEVSTFETACAKYLGVKHAIGVSSGSDALLLALMSIGIKPGDEVICPSYTFFATAGAVARLGATPIFVDLELETYNWDLEAVFQAHTPRTRAVIPVHLFGQAAAMEGLMDWAKAHDICVIEDVAQSMGATWKGQQLGSIGDMGCFSFFPSKNLGGFGDGGLITTQDDALAEQVRILRAHGSKPKYYHQQVGGNFRLDALQAALLSVKLPHLNSYLDARIELANHYLEHLHSSCIEALPEVAKDNKMVWNQFVLRLKSPEARDTVQEHLTQNGVASAIYYPLALHQQACFAQYNPPELKNAEYAAQRSLAIPIFPGMTTEEQNYIIDIFKGL